MKSLYRLGERVRTNQPIPFPIAGVLEAATVAFRIGMWLRLRQPQVRADAHVISLGNITVGGTGKTPAVIDRVRTEMAAGKKVAVLTRGYRSKRTGPPIALDTRVQDRNACRILGDEPALIARKVPGVIIVKCVDRVAAARTAVTQFKCDTLILDDGFQHVRLARDENILVVDATNPFGNGHLVPRGILREPVTAAQRATAVLLTRCDQARDAKSLIARLEALCPGVPIRKTRHVPHMLWRVADGASLPLSDIRGREVRAVCAIGRPEAFFTTLESLGATITERLTFPDHSAIPASALSASGLVVTTEKDAVCLKEVPANVLAVCIELEDYE